MFEIISVREAVEMIRDGDVVLVNAFLGLSNAEAIHDAITESYRRTGSPKELTLISAPGFGKWDADRCAEPYIREGAVRRLILGHYGSMVSTTSLIKENRFEMYNLPLGAISHAIRAQAAGQPGCARKVGLGIFVDPRVEGPGLNAISTDASLVQPVTIAGEEYLYYSLPKANVAIIKGTSADQNGNISFEDEFVTVDALISAQAVHANGGKVIVQVDRIRHDFVRPRDVIVPGALVDAIVVVPAVKPSAEDTSRLLSGDIHVPSSHLRYWMDVLNEENSRSGKGANPAADIICRRAAQELRPGDIVNLGIGIPETVGKYALKSGVLDTLTLTVESGGQGGLPASGQYFGATLGADMVCDLSTQFDFYDGGGLDICFMGALEVDRFGNVNVHRGKTMSAGVGGFANITAATKTVVFCLTFSAKGLQVEETDGEIHIRREGDIPKLCRDVTSISFSAAQAVAAGQRVLYVTERCVFELTGDGLCLKEVYPGIDRQKDILDQLPFSVLLPET